MVTSYLNALNTKECQEIISKCSPYLEPLQIMYKDGVQSYHNSRIAEGVLIYENPPVIQKVKNIVSQITGLPIKNQENPQVVKYNVGGKYEYHNDYIESGDGNDRKYSCMFYLNEEGLVGGATHFPEYKLKIYPTLGALVKWDNLLPNGIPDRTSLHAGLPVTKGEKWILIIWVRENYFI